MSNRPLPSSFDSDPDFFEESRLNKFFRRLREEPLIPIGCALTCVALYKATKSIKSGNKEQTNKMFRARVYAQGFTLAAMCAGSAYYAKDREARKEKELGIVERKHKEKQAAWVRELEIRDQEDKEMRERAKKISERRRAREAESIAEKAQQMAIERAEESVEEKKS